MDIQARKIHFVQEFLRLRNEDLISKFESILRSEKHKDYERTLEPMSIGDFNKIIDNAEDDSLNGRLMSDSDFQKEIDSWS